MGWGRAGQSQVLTAVLLGGIIVAGISSAYLWGLPILQKNQDVTQVRDTLSSIRDVSTGISSVAQEGGSRSVDLSLGDGTIRINPENDTITYTTLAQGAYVSTEDWVPLNENDIQGVDVAGTGDGYGIRGVDEPALLIGKSERAGSEFLTQYKVVMRPLKDPNTDQTHKIDLVQNGNLQASGGTHSIVFQKQTDEVDAGSGIDGSALHRTTVRIRIS